jgi:hypothetical protein
VTVITAEVFANSHEGLTMPDIIRVTFDREPPVQCTLFNGQAWLWAASVWIAEQGLQAEGWEAVTRRFKASGQWYRIQFDWQTNEWHVQAD